MARLFPMVTGPNVEPGQVYPWKDDLVWLFYPNGRCQAPAMAAGGRRCCNSARVCIVYNGVERYQFCLKHFPSYNFLHLKRMMLDETTGVVERRTHKRVSDWTDKLRHDVRIT